MAVVVPAMVSNGCRGYCLTAQGASEAAGFVCFVGAASLWLSGGGLVVSGCGDCQGWWSLSEALVVEVVDVLRIALGLGFGFSWGWTWPTCLG